MHKSVSLEQLYDLVKVVVELVPPLPVVALVPPLVVAVVLPPDVDGAPLVAVVPPALAVTELSSEAHAEIESPMDRRVRRSAVGCKSSKPPRS